jgi:zona occludens toxin (predicted ATPase)
MKTKITKEYDKYFDDDSVVRIRATLTAESFDDKGKSHNFVKNFNFEIIDESMIVDKSMIETLIDRLDEIQSERAEVEKLL